MILKLLLKNSFGHHRFYPLNDQAEVILKLMKRTSFTLDQVKELKAAGFTIEFNQDENLNLLG